MRIHGDPRGSTGIHRDPSGSIGIHGDPRGPLEVQGDPWKSMRIHGDPMGLMEIQGDPWGSMRIHGDPRGPCGSKDLLFPACLKHSPDCTVLPGESMAKQHRLVICKIELQTQRQLKQKGIRKTKGWKLNDQDCQDRFVQ